MRVIDLLVKIANGEEYRNCNLIWHSKITGQHMEENIDAGTFIYESLFYNDITLNDEVEVIEDPEDEEITEWSNFAISEMKKEKNLSGIKTYIETIMRTQNEIIKKINKD